MKKFITLLLALALVFAFGVTSFAEAENFASDCYWEQGVLSAKSDFTVTDGVCVAKNITAEYRSPSMNILPAIKAALADDDEVSLILTYQMRVTMVDEGDEASVRPLLRGANGLSEFGGKENAGDWMEAYEESLDGDLTFFSNSNGNIIRVIHDAVTLTDGEWTEINIELDLTSAQVLTPAVIKWNLCADKISNFENIKTLEYKDVSIILADEAEEPEEDEKPVEKPEEKPEEKPQEATPAPTVAPTAAPTEAPTEAPDETLEPSPEVTTDNTNEGDDGGLLIPITAAICVVIIAAAAVCCILVKKKVSEK